MPFVCHTTIQQDLNHNRHKTFIANKGKNTKTSLNLRHCCQTNSLSFGTGKGRDGGLENVVALFGKKQKLNHSRDER